MGGKYFFSYEMRELKFREVENKSSTTCLRRGRGLLFSLSLPVTSSLKWDMVVPSSQDGYKDWDG